MQTQDIHLVSLLQDKDNLSEHGCVLHLHNAFKYELFERLLECGEKRELIISWPLFSTLQPGLCSGLIVRLWHWIIRLGFI